MTKTLKASEAKTKFFELLRGVADREDEIVVTKDGEPTAILLNYGEYEQLVETMEVLSDPDAIKRLKKGEQYLKRGGRLLSHAEVFGVRNRKKLRR